MKLEELVDTALVRKARAAIHSRDDETFAEQLRIATIAAPTGEERARAAYIARRFVSMGLVNTTIDRVGNVLGTLPGWGCEPGADHSPVVVSAHLDTIFPVGTPINLRREENRVYAPGITDNSRGVAALLRVAETLIETDCRLRHPLVFVATVGEEGLGDLRGVKYLFRRGSGFEETAAFIAIDGAGSTRIIHSAIGARRLRFTIVGSGGHSWGDRGMASPSIAMGAAIARLVELAPDRGSAVNAGRLGGGTSVNAIPSDCWCEVDLRARNGGRLEVLERQTRELFEEATREETRRSGWGVPLECRVERIGDRPCGETPAGNPLVCAAVAATRFLGETPDLGASSTDANVPISLGIPAIAIGAGGYGGGVHTHSEWYDNTNGARGIERALLITLAAAGLRPVDQLSVARASTTE
jgi:acetylornithine deacetylase/succinyl-diaminopimelate desuccinylase-like protein